ncbi:MAG: hypothetical protein H6742_00745 [Alphaproteobacteria bacterium]|nr:hypothetical protein [Alphaproteobacteria bacterium]
MRRFLLLIALALPPSAVLLAPAPAVAQDGPVLAVLPFANQTGDATWDALGGGLADMLVSDLASVDRLTLVERARLQDLLDELALAEGTFVDPATAGQLGRGLGARYVLVGSFSAVAPEMRLDARVVDVSSGEIVHTASAAGPRDEFFLLQKELAAGLTDGLGIALSAREQARMGRVQTESFAAFQAWSEGLAALDRGELDAARDRLQAALVADDRFGLAESALDDAQDRLQASGARSEEVRTEAARRVYAALRALPQDGSADPAAVVALVHPKAWQPELPAESRDLLAVSGAVLALGLPDDASLDLQVTRMGVNEWALANHTLAAVYLRRHADVITFGQELLDRYPMTSWAQSVRHQLQASIDLLRKAEAGRAELPLLRQQAAVTEALWTCTAGAVPAVVGPACEAAWSATEGLPAVVRAQAGKDAVEGLVHAGRLQRAREIGAEVAALPADDSSVARWQTLCATALRNLDQDLADIDKRRAGLSKAVDGGRHAALADRLARVGRHDEARKLVAEGLQRFPDNPALLEEVVALAVAVHDLDTARDGLEAWEASAGPVNDRIATAARQLPDAVAEAGQGRSRALSDLARDLSARGLYGEAADTWLQLLDAAPAADRAGLLHSAGVDLSLAGRTDEARRVFEELLERHPDHALAESARIQLQMTPR